MRKQQLVIELGSGRKRRVRTVEVPAHDLLVAASIELRRLGEGEHTAVKRYGNCIGAYLPPGSYTVIDVDPFTGERGAPTPGTIPEKCTFYFERKAIATAMFEYDTPQLRYHFKRTSVPEPGPFEPREDLATEGAARQELQTVYERDPKLRATCIRVHGSRCMICGVSFEELYGDAAAGFIHVHHLEPLGVVGEVHEVNPATDLVPLCPNCHGVIHLRTPPFTPEEVRAMLDRKRQDS